MSGFTYLYDVGVRYGRTHYIGVRATPNLNTARSFAVVLFYGKDDGKPIEVAKIDDSEHEAGVIHFGRYYRAEGAKRKDFAVDISSIFEAEELLKKNWQKYAHLYQENHGRR